MATRDRELAEALLKIARTVGAADLHLERGGDHPHVCGMLSGRPLRFAFAGTTGSRRTFLNTVSDFRNYIRVRWPEAAAAAFVRPAVARSTSPPRRRKPRVQPVEKLVVDQPCVRPDRWLQPLDLIRARLVAGAETPAMVGNSGEHPAAVSHRKSRRRLRAPQFGFRTVH